MQLRPIEINPEMLDKVLVWMGIASQWHSEDILGWEEDSLGWQSCRPVPGAVLSTHRIAGELQGKQTGELKGHEVSPKACFMKQTIGNSYGNIRLIYTTVKNQDKQEFKDGSILKHRTCPQKTEKSALKNEAIQGAHNTMAQEGLPQYNKGHIW